MEKSINLLRVKEEISEKEAKIRRLLPIVSGLILGFYILTVGALFSFRLIQEREARLVTNNISQAKREIESLKRIESLQVAVKERLKFLVTVFKKGEAVDYQDTLSLLGGFTPTGVVLKEIDLNQKGEMNVAGSAANSIVLGEFLGNLSEPGEKFISVVLSSIQLNEAGDYEFDIRLLLKIG